ncbi:DUF1826 domain-containing protein [Alteromonas sp. 5E99-2]|uniref:DUF1826 domain-containing protein n=1 Tax=Alteromonas sp. 5E99-2 TaxID=2817683 RepID=UPI001A986C44|nr:DUF1826 domain-containing protein [Alteromonas sp. 5E99-2]MBO1254385.1 DUF1826 domain-containing protein [Alteromonas sp. 5E99-2]
MQPNISSLTTSFHYDKSPLVLADIFAQTTSLCCWQRPKNNVVEAYFNHAAATSRLELRHVFDIESLKHNLDTLLPTGLGKEQAINDIYQLAEMLTCLFDCKEVGLRLTATKSAMCPRFHVDNIPVRMVTTYLGEGTELIPNESTNIDDIRRNKGEFVGHKTLLEAFDVALLKGSAFKEGHEGAIHRSCSVEEGQWRVLLTLDPM